MAARLDTLDISATLRPARRCALAEISVFDTAVATDTRTLCSLTRRAIKIARKSSRQSSTD
ncbi:MAG TPA: hypothetical protein VMF89_10655, partial [Polyangiales bacterium]|nr:hypothetical protein [Polyangiales bacterium]